MTAVFVILGIIIFCVITAAFACLVHKGASDKQQEDLEQIEFLEHWREGHSK